MIKKFAAAVWVTAAILSLSAAVFAAADDAAGYIYSTDITAYIDDMPISSYNIGGKTVIIAEELTPYGFDVKWDEKARTLNLCVTEYPTTVPEYTPDSTNTPGQKVGKIYKTDIQAFVNGMDTESYNIGGRTALVIEDMGTENDEQKRHSTDRNPHRALGYSVGLMKYVWNAENRTISLYCLRPQAEVTTDCGNVVIERIQNTPYQVGAYSLFDENENVIRPWVSFINDGKEVYLRTEDFLKIRDKENPPTFDELRFSLNNEGVSITVPDENVYPLWYDRFSTVHNSYNALLMIKGNLTINNRVSETESSDMILYNGEIYIGLNAFHSALGRVALSYMYELPKQCTEKIGASKPSHVIVYINDNHINSFNTADGTCYISAKDLSKHGFYVQINENTCRITSPQKAVVLEQSETPETYYHGEIPNPPYDLFPIYNGIYNVTVDGKEISNVYIATKLVFRSPCISVQELAATAGYKIDISDPYKVKIYTN